MFSMYCIKTYICCLVGIPTMDSLPMVSFLIGLRLCKSVDPTLTSKFQQLLTYCIILLLIVLEPQCMLNMMCRLGLRNR